MKYHVAKDGQQAGTFSPAEIRAMLAEGALRPSDLCWQEGMSDWKPIAEVPEASAEEEFNPYAAPESTIDWQRHQRRGEAATLAPLGSRFLGAFVDGLTSGVVGFLFGITGQFRLASDGEFSFGDFTPGVGFAMLCMLLLGAFNVWRLTTYGQTIGKMAAKTRIVRVEDAGNPGFVKAVLLRAAVPALIGAIPFVGWALRLLDILFIFRKDQRCLHDHLAGTIVVEAR